MNHPSKIACLLPMTLAAALALSACDASTFNSNFNAVNGNLKTVNTASSFLSNTALPAAAVATNMAAVGLVNSLSKNATSNVIAVGSGNVIAVGSGNYKVADAGQSGGVSTNDTVTSNFDDSTHTGSLSSIDGNGKTLVSATFGYTRNTDATTHAIHYAVSNFKGTASGYAFVVNGTFDYTPVADGTAKVACAVTGSLSANGATFSINQLGFDTPLVKGNGALTLPSDETTLGGCTLSQSGAGLPSTTIECTVGTKGGFVVGSANLKSQSGKTIAQFNITPNGFQIVQ